MRNNLIVNRLVVSRLGLAAVSWIAIGAATSGVALAQATSKPDGSSLPPVTVESPKTRNAPATSSPSSRRTAASSKRTASRTHNAEQAASSSQSRGPSGQKFQDPRGPINGYVANRSMTGTKTNTPIMETPQSISVIGADQLRDQKPASVAEALRYTPGVGAQTFGAGHPERLVPDSRVFGAGRRTADGWPAADRALRVRDLEVAD